MYLESQIVASAVCKRYDMFLTAFVNALLALDGFAQTPGLIGELLLDEISKSFKLILAPLLSTRWPTGA